MGKIKSLIKKLTKLGYDVKSKNEKHIDPVCEMAVYDDRFTLEHKGQTYYFCSEHCRSQYKPATLPQ